MPELSPRERKKLEKILRILQEGDLAIAEYLSDMEDKLEDSTEEMSNEFRLALDEIKNNVPNLEKILETIKGKDGDNGEKGDVGEKGERGEDGKDGQDGKDGKDGRDGKDAVIDYQTVINESVKSVSDVLTPLIPKEEDIKSGIIKSGEIVRDSLEKLKGDERLDKSAIKGLEDLDKAIAELQSRPVKSGGTRKIVYTKKHRLTDQCDGLTKSFTLPTDTIEVLGVFGSQFPVNYDPYNSTGGDWSFSGRTLTLSDNVGAPEAGQNLWCLITTLFYG